MAGVATAALGAATAATTAFAVSSVKAGQDFDKSMSQVAATMGITNEELENGIVTTDEFTGSLRDFAQKMGSETAFSATQAADALNYMALAGYDAATSVDMLPKVLNLAAAGNMDLARASDMVTDAQTALGLSLDETGVMVDQMAKTASTTNTSVEQLGDAILTIGANARNINGGTKELSQVLGVLADNGIKGSEAGTHLRNIMLNLTPQTDDAAAAWERLGVSAYDANGVLRDIPTVMQELNAAMDGMTDEEKTNTISAMFNKTDLASVNALLGTSAERWGQVATAIDNAEGSAAAMAETQLDNLAGNITLFKSALEGAQIAISDGLSPTLRDFVQLGTNGISEMTTAFKEDGLSGAMRVLGETISKGIGMITEKLPDAINAGAELLGALVDGIVQNSGKVAVAATQVISNLLIGLAEGLPNFLNGIASAIESVMATLFTHGSEIIEEVIEIIAQILETIGDNLPQIVKDVIQVITKIIEALFDNLPTLIDGIVALLESVVTAIVDNLPLLIEKIPEIIKKVNMALIQSLPILIDGIITMTMAIVDALPEIITAINSALPQIIALSIEALLTCLPQILIGLETLVIEIAAHLPEIMIALIEAIPESVMSIIDAFGIFIEEFPKIFEEGCAGAIETLMTKAQEIVQSTIKFFGNMITITNDGITKFVGNIMEKIKDLPVKVNEKLTEIITNVTTFAKDLALKATTTASNFCKNIKDGLARLPGEMLEIGHNIVNGIINGISEGAGALWDKISNLASTALGKAKEVLGIASPSKEFAKIGRWCVAGFEQGIDTFDNSYIGNTIMAGVNVAKQNIAGASMGAAGGIQYNQTVNVNAERQTPDVIARQIRLESRYGLMRGVALG